MTTEDAGEDETPTTRADLDVIIGALTSALRSHNEAISNLHARVEVLEIKVALK